MYGYSGLFYFHSSNDIKYSAKAKTPFLFPTAEYIRESVSR